MTTKQNSSRDTTNKLTTYDLVTYGPSGKECWGNYNSTSQKGYGPAYENACIHSGAVIASGDLPTNWYNYTLATAGTIAEKNTTSSNPASNMEQAAESICPKGWTLPNRTQTRSIGPDAGSITHISNFFPVLGGGYGNGTLVNEATRGYWWGSEAYNGALRYYLVYNGSSLYTNNGLRRAGSYIRCVQAP